MTISSSRLRNSANDSPPITAACLASVSIVGSTRYDDPRLLVRISSVLRKSPCDPARR